MNYDFTDDIVDSLRAQALPLLNDMNKATSVQVQRVHV